MMFSLFCACRTEKGCEVIRQQMEERQKKQIDESNAQYKQVQERHMKNQSPETRKRIKKNLKQQQKNYKQGKAF